MTVTKSKNLIANRNTGGNKKQGLVSSVGKSNSIRQSQLVKASSNDKTIYCINQVGGVGRFRNQLSSADSTNCISKLYTINSALQDSLNMLHTYNNYLFSFILIYNKKSNETYVFINNSSNSSHIFNSANFSIKNKQNQDQDISFNDISITPNKTFLLTKFSNNEFSFDNFTGYLNIMYRSSENYNDISNNKASLENNGFLYNNSGSPYSTNKSYDIKDKYDYYVNYSPFLYGALYEYKTNHIISTRLKDEFYLQQYIH